MRRYKAGLIAAAKAVASVAPFTMLSERWDQPLGVMRINKSRTDVCEGCIKILEECCKTRLRVMASNTGNVGHSVVGFVVSNLRSALNTLVYSVGNAMESELVQGQPSRVTLISLRETIKGQGRREGGESQ